jgi:hypothetical protein
MSSQPTASTSPLAENPSANTPAEIGQSYYRRASSGLTTIEAIERAGRPGPMGEDLIEEATRCLDDLDTAAVLFEPST